MSFREDFLGADQPSGEHAFQAGLGLRPSAELLNRLRQALRVRLEGSLDAIPARYSHPSFQGEVASLVGRLEKGSDSNQQNGGRSPGQTGSEAETALATRIQQACDHLGSHLCRIRWIAERHVSSEAFRALLEEIGRRNRDTLLRAVELFEEGDYALARKGFLGVLASRPEDYFAQQYLGFIAVQEDDPDDAVSRFEMAFRTGTSGSRSALALYHLYRCFHAAGRSELALDFLKSACETDPRPSFLFEYAAAAALAGNDQTALRTLMKAFLRDWTFWALAIVDPRFDSIRESLAERMDGIRRRAAVRAVEAMSLLQDSIETTRPILPPESLTHVSTRLEELRIAHAENNLYRHREIAEEAGSLRANLFATARDTQLSRIARRQAGLKQAVQEAETQVSLLREPLRLLRRDRRLLENQFRPWEGGCGSYLAICLVYSGFIYSYHAGRAWRDIYLVLYMLGFVAAPLVHLLLNGIRRYWLVSRPVGKLEAQIRRLEGEIEPQVGEVQRKLAEQKARIEADLHSLATQLREIEAKAS